MLGQKIKYIILDGRTPIIFPDHIGHDDMARGQRQRPTSAGFVSLIPISQPDGKRSFINATVYGESISLDLQSQGDKDNLIIEKFLNNFVD